MWASWRHWPPPSELPKDYSKDNLALWTTPKTREWSVSGCLCTSFRKTKNITKIFMCDVDTWKSCIWTGGLKQGLKCVILAIFFFNATYVARRKDWTRFEPWPAAMMWSSKLKFFRPSPAFLVYFLEVGGFQVAFLKKSRCRRFFVLHVSVGNWIEIMVCLCRILKISSLISNFSFFSVNRSTAKY